ncbi:hypothetical protein [Sphingomonas sp. GB1N7]|uniref:hypothetical protein n=1 Tax=Parasphingomonas caseinilytica TaxID=3096158 RepID=UPI002FCAB8DD
MANFFDSIIAKRNRALLQPLVAPIEAADARVYGNAPANVAADQMADAQADAQPMAQQQAPAPEPVHEANPFDEFDAPAPAHHAAPAQIQAPAPVAPIEPGPAPTPAPVDWEANMQVHGDQKATVSEADQQLNADIAMLINNGATKEQIGARLAKDGKGLDTLSGLDEALAWRAHNKGTIQVGLRTNVDKAPVEYHGPDKGKFDAVVTGALDAASLGSADEVGAGVDALGNSIGNIVGLGDGQSIGDRYAQTRDENRTQLKDASYYNPGSYLGGQVIGSLATLPIGGEAALGRTALQTAARAGAEGAAYGGVYGFNSADGGVADRLEAGAKGAALGAGLGSVIGGVTGRIGERIAANRANPSEARQLLNAADNLNAGVPRNEQIRPVIGHTSNGGIGSTLTATGEGLLIPGHVGGIQRATRAVEENSGLARDRIANNAAGGVAEDLNAVAARQANPHSPGSLAAYESESRLASDHLYQQAADAAGNVQLSTPRTIQAIDRKLAQWDAVPGGVAGSQALRDLRDNLSRGTFSVDGLRRLRTSFGDSIDSGNRTVREAANSLWPRLSEDISGGLSRNGLGDAARLYRQADQNYAARGQNLESIRTILGDGMHSADTVADNIARMSRTDYGQLARSISVLPADQQASVRGAIINNLGRALPSKQDLTGESFSLETFLTNWGRDKFSNEAKAAILPPQTVRDLDNLARVASANRALRGKGNASRSGYTVGNIAELGAVGVGGLLSLPVIGAFGGGKLLASPGVARALVNLSENRGIEIVAKRLSEAARRNPAMAQNITGLRDALVSGKVPDHPVTIDGRPKVDPVAAAPAPEPNPFDEFDEVQ